MIVIVETRIYMLKYYIKDYLRIDNKNKRNNRTNNTNRNRQIY